MQTNHLAIAQRPPSNTIHVSGGDGCRPLPLGVENETGFVSHFEILLIFRQLFERRPRDRGWGGQPRDRSEAWDPTPHPSGQ